VIPLIVMLRRDLTKEKFGRLQPLHPTRHNDKHLFWLCRCDCGNLIESIVTNLCRGNTKSCGCLRKDVSKAINLKHGCARQNAITVEYRAYRAAWARCNNPKTINYSRYGGIGVQFKLPSFPEFLAHIGPKPFPHRKFSLDRIRSEGHYEIGNIRWASTHEQRINRRRKITLRG
jgi:hypothetical protein